MTSTAKYLTLLAVILGLFVVIYHFEGAYNKSEAPAVSISTSLAVDIAGLEQPNDRLDASRQRLGASDIALRYQQLRDSARGDLLQRRQCDFVRAQAKTTEIDVFWEFLQNIDPTMAYYLGVELLASRIAIEQPKEAKHWISVWTEEEAYARAFEELGAGFARLELANSLDLLKETEHGAKQNWLANGILKAVAQTDTEKAWHLLPSLRANGLINPGAEALIVSYAIANGKQELVLNYAEEMSVPARTVAIPAIVESLVQIDPEEAVTAIMALKSEQVKVLAAGAAVRAWASLNSIEASSWLASQRNPSIRSAGASALLTIIPDSPDVIPWIKDVDDPVAQCDFAVQLFQRHSWNKAYVNAIIENLRPDVLKSLAMRVDLSPAQTE